LIFLCFFALLGCQSSPDALTGSVLEVRPTPVISHPGMVAVDVVSRRKQLNDANSLEKMCKNIERVPMTILHKAQSPSGYGLDDRYSTISKSFRDLGEGCLRGNVNACKKIQSYSLEWSKESKLRAPSNQWNDTLTINMRLLSPMISALAVSEQVIPMKKSEKVFLTRWLKEKVDRFEHGLRGAGRYGAGSGTHARKAAHNHAVQSSIAAMSYGAWADDASYFETGIEQWFITLSSMRDDGSLPIETRRGARALFYQGRTMSALVQLAERANVQGIDLYNSAPSFNKTIHHTVSFFIDSILDTETVLKYAKSNKYPGPSKSYKYQDLGSSGSTLGWVAPYISKFPDHPNTIRLKKLVDSKNMSFKSNLPYRLISAVHVGGWSSEWIGVNARCFYASPSI